MTIFGDEVDIIKSCSTTATSGYSPDRDLFKEISLKY
jgi:hypothetical protein